MKHTIKFRKAILNANWAGDYSVIADSTILNILYGLAERRMGFRIKKIKIRERASDLRSKVVVDSAHDCEWNKFVSEFLDMFDGYIEGIYIK